MFENLLAAIFASRGLNDALSQSAYLAGLKQTARDLWNSYRTDDIDIDYSHPDTQVVYMTRYFPFYSFLISEELNGIGGGAFPVLQKDVVVASLFCSGPLPEAVAISRFLSTTRNVRTLIVNTFDLHVNGWNEMRNAVANAIINPGLPACVTHINPVQYNLADPISESNLQIVETSDFIVYQNCLNEITAAEIDVFETSVKRILERMPANSLLIIVERQGYLIVNALMARIAGLCAEFNMEMLTPGIPDKTYSNSPLKKRILNTACDQLYVSFIDPPNGLILAPSVKYSSLVMRKKGV